jgi:sugar/nucleoside kinase (ribokinase family)
MSASPSAASLATSPDVISLGTMLVEIMRTGLDQPMDRPGPFIGPFPSGDTCIYTDSVARLGRSAGFIGCVGPDDFGRCLLDRFVADGVDTSQVQTLAGQTTGVAFVAYFTGGSRKFIYHWRYAAAGLIAPEHVQPAYVGGAKWLHLTGCTMAASESGRDACYRAVELLPAGATLSFDANVRPELMTVEELRAMLQPVIARADVILPSLGEAQMLTGAADDEAGCREWVAQGKTVVLKMGAQGCRIYRGDEVVEAPGFQVDEVDPTGAGDSFCGGFTVAMLEGMGLAEAGRFANAVGALAVGKMGPMEGAPTRAEVEAFLAARS